MNGFAVAKEMNKSGCLVRNSIMMITAQIMDGDVAALCGEVGIHLKPGPTREQLKSLQIEAQRSTVWLLPALGSCFVPFLFGGMLVRCLSEGNTAPRSLKPGKGSSFFRSRLFFRSHPVLI